MTHSQENRKRQYTLKQNINREDQSFHEKADSEQQFYAAVRTGNVSLVEKLLYHHGLCEKKELGVLSDSPIQNIKYHFAISTALVARHCIEGGMIREEAFSLSDAYIYEADQLLNAEQIDRLLYKMFLDYTNRMKHCLNKEILSKEISRCMDYIYEHLHERITTEELARAVGFERSYLSRLFKKQTGESLATYIMNKKLEAAKNMLLYSEYDIAMITQLLAFSSQSYLTTAFKKRYGLTPKQYRDQYDKKVYGK